MRRLQRGAGLLLAASTAVVLSCASNGDVTVVAPSSSSILRSGSWGGEQARLTVAADEPAELELSCAHGRIALPLTIDDDGRFEWSGTYRRERPGPSREDESEGAAARFRGNVDDDRLTLTIVVEGRKVAGPITLTFGKQTRVNRCA